MSNTPYIITSNRKSKPNNKIIIHDFKTKGKTGIMDWDYLENKYIEFEYDGIVGRFKVCEYIKKGQILKILYNGEIRSIRTTNVNKVAIGGILGVVSKNFKLEIGENLTDFNRDLVITHRLYVKNKNMEDIKFYKYKCNKCGFDCGEHYRKGILKNEHLVSEYHLLRGDGCSCCTNPVRMTVVGINDIETTHPNLSFIIDDWHYIKNKFHEGSMEKVNIRCPTCNNKIKRKTTIRDACYNNFSCGMCNDGFSYGSKYIFCLLSQFEYNFKNNITPKWCEFYNIYKDRQSNGEYDFIIEDLKLIIEVDGGFHRIDNNISGQTKEESQFLDGEKDRLAKENGYEVIRITYNDNMCGEDMRKNILSTHMKDIFNLNIVDWEQCDTSSLKSRLKEVCETKRLNPNMGTKDISILFKISIATTIDYLKKGSELGLCVYDKRKEHLDGIKNGKTTSKAISLFKDGFLIGEFQNSTQLSNISESLLGEKLYYGGIRKACKGFIDNYKGYIENKAR